MSAAAPAVNTRSIAPPPRNNTRRNSIHASVSEVRRALHLSRRNRANSSNRRNSAARSSAPIIYTPDFGIVDLDEKLAELDLKTFGTMESQAKGELAKSINAIKAYFKKLNFIHVIFQINRNTAQSTSWYSVPPYIYHLFVIDVFGNVYKVDGINYGNEKYYVAPEFSRMTVGLPDVPAGLPSLYWIRTYNDKFVDEDAIIAEGTKLSDSQISFIKSVIPSQVGTALSGIDDYNLALLFNMLPLLQNIAKETKTIYQAI
jgi:hypothetical protein